MADEINKEVLAARINLDTSKVLQSFKTVGEGAKQNAEAFKLLNAEIVTTEKTYTALAKSMDKLALSSDERKKKILDESNALVAQRTAQAELLKAKASAMDTHNQTTDSKLAAQQAIQKRREDAIEQQEREHLQRMEILQQRAARVQPAGKSTTAGSSEDSARERVLREEQSIRSKLAQMAEKENQQHIKNAKDYEKWWTSALDTRERKEIEVRERVLQDEQKIRRTMEQNAIKQMADMDKAAQHQHGLIDMVKQAAIHSLVFNSVHSAMNETAETLKTAIVDVESNMAGYVQTNEKYFLSYDEGTKEMVMNTQKLHDETTKFLRTTHDLGSEITEVTESARLWGRMYKDVGIVQELVRQSTKLSTVDLVGLNDATKMMESTIAQYGVKIKDSNDAMVQGNRLLDSWSKVAHDTMAPAQDLGAAFERTGKIAAESGVSFDFMNGLISSGIRNTALSGENLGNMWKTVLGTIKTDKAVNEIESLGVATKEVVNGAEQWRRAEDILLDLTVKVTDKNYDLTQSYAAISRGVYQYAKLAASLNTGDILLGTAASINSTGSTAEYLRVQMDTIDRKAKQVRASLLEIFSTAGDDGLRSTIKGVLDTIDQLLIGVTKIPKGVLETTATLAGLIIAYQTLSKVVTTLGAAQRVLTAAKAADTAVTLAETVAIEGMTVAQAQAARTTALATGGLTLLAGAISVYLMAMGNTEKKERELEEQRRSQISVNQQMMSQYDRQIEFLPKLVNAHNELQKVYDGLTESAKTNTEASKKQIEVKGQLDKISQALTMTIKSEGVAQLQAANYTADAVQKQIAKIKEARAALDATNLAILNSEKNDIATKMKNKMDQVNKDQHELNDWVDGSSLNPFRSAAIEKNRKEIDKGVKEVNKLEQQLRDKELQIAELNGQAAIDAFKGSSEKALKDQQDQEDQFDSEMSEFKHNVNRRIAGYTTADEQLNKLSTIRDKFSSLKGKEKYENLLDDIARTGSGNEITAKGYGSTSLKSFSFPLDQIDNEVKQAKMLVDSADGLINFYNAKKGALSNSVDDTAQMIELYTNKQNKLHEANEIMRESLTALADKQVYLNTLYSNGQINLEEYNKSSEDVTSRIATLTKEVDNNSIAWWNEAKAIKDAQEQVQKDAFSASEKWVSHEKAIREMSAAEEYAAWVDVRSRLTSKLDMLEKERKKLVEINEERKKTVELSSTPDNFTSGNGEIVDFGPYSGAWGNDWETTGGYARRQFNTADGDSFFLDPNGSFARWEDSPTFDEEIKNIQDFYEGKTEEILNDSHFEQSIIDIIQQYSYDPAKIKSYFKSHQEVNTWKQDSIPLDELQQAREEYEKTGSAIAKINKEIEATKNVSLDLINNADEKVYAARKALLQDEEKALDDLVAKQKKQLNESKAAELKDISTRKEAFVTAQDEKIKAIERLIAAQDTANGDTDYNKKLAEKQARLKVLDAGVGPEAIKERRDLAKEIEDMQLERQRSLNKRALESAKQALEDEKDAKGKSFDAEQKAVESHYDALDKAFESYGSDMESKAEALKKIQIMKESEKNAEILKNLDSFVAQYQSKMALINSLSTSQKDIDLAEYNSNKDRWESANIRGDIAEMARLQSRNNELRSKYGISSDTGKLQQFEVGGTVRGVKGQAVPVIAHAGEMILNDRQQAKLFGMLDYAMPKVSWPETKFSTPQSIVYNNYNYDNSIGEVAVSGTNGVAGLYDQRSGLITRQQSLGGKVR